MSKVTMQMIADKLGITKVTVSKALRDKEGVSDSLRKKIKNTAREMGYTYNSSAGALKTKSTGLIGVLVPESFLIEDENFYTRLYKDIIVEANKQGTLTILNIVHEVQEKYLELPLVCQEQRVDGIIVLGQLSKRYIEKLMTLDIPLVLVDFYYKDIRLDTILTDNVLGSYYITEYLIKNGHRDICFIGNINFSSSIQDRYLGYYKALIENNITNVQVMDHFDKNMNYAFKMPTKLPTAFVCNNDKTAFEFIKFLRQHNISVPEQCSVVGFDDVIQSTLTTPQLTTVKVNRKEMAKNAILVMKNRIQNKNYPIQKIQISTKIIIRDSVLKIN